MTALTRNITRKSQTAGGVLLSVLFAMPVAAATTIYQGSLLALNQSGYLVKASADASLRVVGVSEDKVDNSAGAAGDLTCKPVRGAWYFANSSTTDAVIDADLGRPCYVVDDNTVARTNGNGARPMAGIVVGVDADGVLVEVGTSVDRDAADDFLVLANASLTTKQFHFVYLVNSSDVPKAAYVAAAGGRPDGILQNAPDSGAVAVIRPCGSGKCSKLIAGGVVTCGDAVASKNDGRAKTAVAGTVAGGAGDPANDALVGSYAGGVAMATSANDGDVIYVRLTLTGAIPTTAA